MKQRSAESATKQPNKRRIQRSTGGLRRGNGGALGGSTASSSGTGDGAVALGESNARLGDASGDGSGNVPSPRGLCTLRRRGLAGGVQPPG